MNDLTGVRRRGIGHSEGCGPGCPAGRRVVPFERSTAAAHGLAEAGSRGEIVVSLVA